MPETININAITINPERQRKDLGDLTELKNSIETFGLINAIVITREGELIAGERRLTCCKQLGFDQVDIRYYDTLDKMDLRILEYEENAKRQQLSWKEECEAVVGIHNTFLENDPTWTKAKTADKLNMSRTSVSRFINIQNEVATGNTKVLEAKSLKTAANVANRARKRKVDNAVAKITIDTFKEATEETQDATTQTVDKPESVSSSYDDAAQTILNTDFNEWASSYSGEKFNVIHCDFPYGINHGKSDKGGAAYHGAYEDSPDVYWKLCNTLATHLDRIAMPSCHMIFWLSMNYYEETKRFFQENTNFKLCTPMPLIWHKSDNKGIVPDVERRPRHIYETALFFSRGDRRIISPIGDVYSCPTSKEVHISEKPQAMLEHFFRLCVDGLAEVLDPTCGSGTSIRAAERLGASRTLGLELNPDYTENARTLLHNQRLLAKAAEKTNG